MSAPLSLWQEFENWLDSIFGFGATNTIIEQPASPTLQTLSTATPQAPTQTSSTLSTIGQDAAAAAAVIGVVKAAVPIITGVVGSIAGTGAVAGTGAGVAGAGAAGAATSTAATTVTTGAVSGGIEIGADGSIIGVAGAEGGATAGGAGAAGAAGGGSAAATGGAAAAAPILGVATAVAAVVIVAVVFTGIGNKNEEEKWEAQQEAEFGFRWPKITIHSPVDGKDHLFGADKPVQDFVVYNDDASKDINIATHDYVTGAARPDPGGLFKLTPDGNYWTQHVPPPPPPKLPPAPGRGIVKIA